MNKEEAMKDYERLADRMCSNNPSSQTGSSFVNYFTFSKRLETQGNKGINFWELIRQKPEIEQKNYIINLLKYYKESGSKKNDSQLWFRIFQLYFGGGSIFKPVIAMEIYCRFKPQSVLDMTMGWGGRLVGACALNIPNYIGIDLNTSLKKPYGEMVKVLNKVSTTNIKLLFKDALKVDYSKLDYDMVLTSPPYYNTEIYQGSKKMEKEKWDRDFYTPLFQKTFKGMKSKGHYCLNVPAEVYEDVAKKVLGKAKYFIPMPKAKRTEDEKYKEYIYVWVKS